MKNSATALLALALLAIAGNAAAQPASAPAPAQPAAQPPQPATRPTLNLRLDERELRSIIPPSSKETYRKQDAADGLPGLGGNPKREFDQPSPEQVVPKSNDKL
jgi:hypothetical protein